MARAKREPRRKLAKDGSRRGGARKGAGHPRGPARPKVALIHGFEDLGDPPAETDKIVEWAMAVNAVAMNEVRKQLAAASAETHRKSLRAELRTITKTMLAAIPRARLFEAEARVRGESADMRRPVKDPPVGPRPGKEPEPDAEG